MTSRAHPTKRSIDLSKKRKEFADSFPPVGGRLEAMMPIADVVMARNYRRNSES